MNLFAITVLYGLAACALAGVLLYLIGRINPRIMLQDYPRDVQAAVPAKASAERRQTAIVAMPLWMAFLGFPLAAALTAKAAGAGPLVIGLCAFGVGLIANLFDLLIVDWLMFCTWTRKLSFCQGPKEWQATKTMGYIFVGF
jgi:hypothetical protein